MSHLSSYFLLFFTLPVADGLVIFGARCLPIIERSGNKSLCFHSYHIHVRRGKAINIAIFSWSLRVDGKSTTKTVLCYELRYFENSETLHHASLLFLRKLGKLTNVALILLLNVQLHH